MPYNADLLPPCTILVRCRAAAAPCLAVYTPPCACSAATHSLYIGFTFVLVHVLGTAFAPRNSSNFYSLASTLLRDHLPSRRSCLASSRCKLVGVQCAISVACQTSHTHRRLPSPRDRPASSDGRVAVVPCPPLPGCLSQVVPRTPRTLLEHLCSRHGMSESRYGYG